MEQIKELEDLLRAFPLWEEGSLQIDSTVPEPGSCGLFSMGTEELSRQEDVTGNLRLRLRQRFILRRVFPRGEDAAGWLLQLQQWLPRNIRYMPGFGLDCVIRAEKGQLGKTRQPGTDIYEVTVTVDFTKENENGEN